MLLNFFIIITLCSMQNNVVEYTAYLLYSKFAEQPLQRFVKLCNFFPIILFSMQFLVPAVVGIMRSFGGHRFLLYLL